MGIAIRIENLRKVYDTPPPMAGGGAGFSFAMVRSPGRRNRRGNSTWWRWMESLSRSTPGKCSGFSDPTGGKSTTIGILTTRTQPTSGRAFIGEFDVWQQQVKAKRLIGVVPQRPNLDFASPPAKF